MYYSNDAAGTSDMHKEMNKIKKQKEEKSREEALKEQERASMLVVSSGGDKAVIAEQRSSGEESLVNMVNKPSKIVRIDDMVKKILEEVKSTPLDEISKASLKNTFDKFIGTLKTSVSEELADEIDDLVAPLSDAPSEIELRLAYTKLVGWLEGLFRGIQTILLTQQVMGQGGVGMLGGKRKVESKQQKGKGDDDDSAGGQYL
jgi:hypothetical protein